MYQRLRQLYSTANELSEILKYTFSRDIPIFLRNPFVSQCRRVTGKIYYRIYYAIKQKIRNRIHDHCDVQMGVSGREQRERRRGVQNEDGNASESRIAPARNPAVCAQIGCYLSAAGDRRTLRLVRAHIHAYTRSPIRSHIRWTTYKREMRTLLIPVSKRSPGTSFKLSVASPPSLSLSPTHYFSSRLSTCITWLFRLLPLLIFEVVGW